MGLLPPASMARTAAKGPLVDLGSFAEVIQQHCSMFPSSASATSSTFTELGQLQAVPSSASPAKQQSAATDGDESDNLVNTDDESEPDSMSGMVSVQQQHAPAAMRNETSSSQAFPPFAVALKYARSLELNSKEAWVAWARVMCDANESHRNDLQQIGLSTKYPMNPGMVANATGQDDWRT